MANGSANFRSEARSSDDTYPNEPGIRQFSPRTRRRRWTSSVSGMLTHVSES